jgi:cysteine synthase A
MGDVPSRLSTAERAEAAAPRADARLHGLGHMIGNTPLLAVRYSRHEETRTLYANAENLSMTASIKDRMALHLLRQAARRGLLASGAPIAEATSGDAGIAFSAVGRALATR